MPAAARTILLFHIISARPSKQARMVRSILGVYSFGLIFVSARTNKRHHHRLGPSYFCISLVLGPLNSLVWYVPSLRYTRDLGSRIHCGVEVTESSTNKQHHHPLRTYPRCRFCNAKLPSTTRTWQRSSWRSAKRRPPSTFLSGSWCRDQSLQVPALHMLQYCTIWFKIT
jgi:hypothetical protein